MTTAQTSGRRLHQVDAQIYIVKPGILFDHIKTKQQAICINAGHIADFDPQRFDLICLLSPLVFRYRFNQGFDN
jgi:hypothetical protein